MREEGERGHGDPNPLELHEIAEVLHSNDPHLICAIYSLDLYVQAFPCKCHALCTCDVTT